MGDGQAQLRNQEEGSTNGEGNQVGTGGSREDRDLSGGGGFEAQSRQMPAELREIPAELRVCVMCKGKEADSLCKWCRWPLHGERCALPVRDPATGVHISDLGPYLTDGEEGACVDCLCREYPPCCVWRYAAC